MRPLLSALLLFAAPLAADRLFNGRDLAGWEVGDGLRNVMRDGTLVAQFDPKYEGRKQSWLVSKGEYENFTLSLEFWARLGTNSGISIRDPSRAQGEKTPSFIGFEIQVTNQPGDEWPTGSVFRIKKADRDNIRPFDWNRLEIDARGTHLKVSLNGEVVCELDDTTRARKGSIGLQLHDKATMILFRNIELRP